MKVHTQLRTHAVALAMLTALSSGVQAQTDQLRVRGTNTNYRPGDWVSYGVTRFVNCVAVGLRNVYFGTTGGITRYNFYTNEWETPLTVSSGLADNVVTAVAFDEDTGFLWAATELSISYLHPSSERWTNQFKDELGLPRFDHVVSIGIGQDDLLFVTQGGRRFRTSKFGGTLFASNNGSGQGPSSRRWFGQYASVRPPYPLYYMGEGYIFGQNGWVQDLKMRRAEVTSVVRDQWMKLWMGTWRLGAIKGDSRTEFLELIPHGLFSPRVDAFAFDSDGVWFAGLNQGTEESGITYWDQQRKRWTYYESRYNVDLLSDEISRMTLLGDTLFCATRFGVSIFNTRRNEWSRLTPGHGLAHEHTYDVVTEDGFLWVATGGGVNRIRLASMYSDSLEIDDIAPDLLRALPVYDIEVTNSAVWAATGSGIFSYSRANGDARFVQDATGPQNAFANCVSRFKNELWFGGRGSIEVLDMLTGEWLSPPERNMTLQADVLAIAANDVAVWAGTDQGVFRFDRRTRSWRQYTIEDGLMNRYVSAVALDGDYVWFGSNEGATAFFWNDPHRVD